MAVGRFSLLAHGASLGIVMESISIVAVLSRTGWIVAELSIAWS
jgi:hypothetical protein